MEDTYNGRRTLIECNLWIEDDLCWKMTFNRIHAVMDRNNTTQGEGGEKVNGLFFAKAFRSKTKRRLEFDTEDQVLL